MGDEVRLEHIFDTTQKIEKAIEGNNFNSFFENETLVAALERWLQIIGEAAKHISDETKSKYPDIEWRKIIALRNIVTHEYFDINYEVIWETATIHIKELKKQLTAIKLETNNDFLTN